MDDNAIGIVVVDESNKIFFYENNFFIKKAIHKEDNIRVLFQVS